MLLGILHLHASVCEPHEYVCAGYGFELFHVLSNIWDVRESQSLITQVSCTSNRIFFPPEVLWQIECASSIPRVISKVSVGRFPILFVDASLLLLRPSSAWKHFAGINTMCTWSPKNTPCLLLPGFTKGGEPCWWLNTFCRSLDMIIFGPQCIIAVYTRLMRISLITLNYYRITLLKVSSLCLQPLANWKGLNGGSFAFPHHQRVTTHVVMGGLIVTTWWSSIGVDLNSSLRQAITCFFQNREGLVGHRHRVIQKCHKSVFIPTPA